MARTRSFVTGFLSGENSERALDLPSAAPEPFSWDGVKSASTARALATSPFAAPPIPSERTKRFRSGEIRKLSSLVGRTTPLSVQAATSQCVAFALKVESSSRASLKGAEAPTTAGNTLTKRPEAAIGQSCGFVAAKSRVKTDTSPAGSIASQEPLLDDQGRTSGEIHAQAGYLSRGRSFARV